MNTSADRHPPLTAPSPGGSTERHLRRRAAIVLVSSLGLVAACGSDDGTDEGTEEGVDDGTDDGTEECVADEAELPVGSKEFSAWVVQGAQDPDKVGAEFGAEVSEQARELRDEKAEERAENGTGNGGASNGFGNGGRDDDDTDDTDDAEDAPREGGKPEGVGGGRP